MPITKFLIIYSEVLIRISVLFSVYECYSLGSIYGFQHNPDTGTCTCKPGVSGEKCEGKMKFWSYHFHSIWTWTKTQGSWFFYLSWIAEGKITLTDPNGVITSPGFPNDYPANSNISWLIQLPKGKFIEFNFLNFRTQGCYLDDSLTIYNGASDASPVIRKFCGDDLPESFISPSNQVLLVFKSDGSINYKGFQLEYKTSSKSFWNSKLTKLLESSVDMEFKQVWS